MNAFSRSLKNTCLLSAGLFSLTALAVPKLKPAPLIPKVAPLAITAFRVPTVTEMIQEREDERWACIRAAGLNPPVETDCADCATGAKARAPSGKAPGFMQWLVEHLREVNAVKGCKTPELLRSEQEHRVDLRSCREGGESAILRVANDSQRVLFRAGECLRRLNPALYQKLAPGMRELSQPLYSCLVEGSSENLNYWEGRCRERLANPKSAKAEADVKACVAVFTQSRRVTIQHPVFPDRWIVRIAEREYRPMVEPDVVARVQFRELFERAGLGSDSALADGCLGACGPLPGVAYVTTRQGCQQCALFRQTSAAELDARRACALLPQDSWSQAVSEYQSYQECSAAIERGDTRGLARACNRLQAVAAYKRYCSGKAPAECLKDRLVSSELDRTLRVPYQKALENLKNHPDWITRSAL